MTIILLILLSCIFIFLPYFKKSKNSFILSLKIAPLALVSLSVLTDISREIFLNLGVDYYKKFDFLLLILVALGGYCVVQKIAKTQSVIVTTFSYIVSFILMIFLSIVIHIGVFFYQMNNVSYEYKDINVGDNFSLEYKRLKTLCFECDYRIGFKSGKKVDIMSNPAGLDHFKVYKLDEDLFLIKSVDFYMDVMYKINTKNETVKQVDFGGGDLIGVIKHNKYTASKNLFRSPL